MDTEIRVVYTDPRDLERILTLLEPITYKSVSKPSNGKSKRVNIYTKRISEKPHD